MKIPATMITLVAEIAFIVFCINMTYRQDALDAFPLEWMIPNMLIVGAILVGGFLVVSWLSRDLTYFQRKWSNNERK